VDLVDFVNNILLKNEIIISADINTAIGIREIYEFEGENNNDNTINDLIGPHRNPRHNKLGTIIREVLWELDYRVMSMFFDNNNKHDMWIHLAMKAGYQPDHVLIPCNQLRMSLTSSTNLTGLQVITVSYFLPTT